jgi:hypothetical protein
VGDGGTRGARAQNENRFHVALSFVRLERVAALDADSLRDLGERAEPCERGLKHVQTDEERESEPRNVVAIRKHHPDSNHDPSNAKNQPIDIHN